MSSAAPPALTAVEICDTVAPSVTDDPADSTFTENVPDCNAISLRFWAAVLRLRTSETEKRITMFISFIPSAIDSDSLRGVIFKIQPLKEPVNF